MNCERPYYKDLNGRPFLFYVIFGVNFGRLFLVGYDHSSNSALAYSSGRIVYWLYSWCRHSNVSGAAFKAACRLF